MSDEIKPVELTSIAIALAGHAASDEEIIAQFHRAESLLSRAREWLNEDRDLADMLEAARAADEILPWSSRDLRQIAGRATDYRPTMMVLVGIAAGWRPKLQIGHVVWPRHVVAITATEVRKRPAFRTKTHEPPAAVAQMLHSWKVKDEELAAHTARIMDGLAVTGTDLEGPDGRKLVAYPPKAEECVISSGDFLLRHDGHFVKLRKIDPQVCACEMECAGMVLALQTMNPTPAWLQIRGISDFGDSQKNDDWQPYAAAGASAFVRLFAERCFDPVLISGKKASPPTVTTSPEQAVKPRSIATTVAVEALETSPAIPAGVLPEFERIRDAWKKGREVQTTDKLQALRRSAAFAAATPETRAKVLRFEAKVVLDISHDVASAEALVQQARELAGEHRASEAQILAHKTSASAAADALAKPTTLEEWNLRMGFLLQAREADLLLSEWDTPPEGVGPDAESYRLQTYALLIKKRVADARTAFAKIGAKHREGFAIRLACTSRRLSADSQPACAVPTAELGLPAVTNIPPIQKYDGTRKSFFG